MNLKEKYRTINYLSYKCHNIVTYASILISWWIRCFCIVTLRLGERAKQGKAVDRERLLADTQTWEIRD